MEHLFHCCCFSVPLFCPLPYFNCHCVRRYGSVRVFGKLFLDVRSFRIPPWRRVYSFSSRHLSFVCWDARILIWTVPSFLDFRRRTSSVTPKCITKSLPVSWHIAKLGPGAWVRNRTRIFIGIWRWKRFVHPKRGTIQCRRKSLHSINETYGGFQKSFCNILGLYSLSAATFQHAVVLLDGVWNQIDSDGKPGKVSDSCWIFGVGPEFWSREQWRVCDNGSIKPGLELLVDADQSCRIYVTGTH